MLEYLIAVQQHTMVLAALLPVLGVGISRAGGTVALRRFIRALAIGGAIAVILALLKTWTGWIVTEYWNLAFMAVIIASGVIFMVADYRVRRRSVLETTGTLEKRLSPDIATPDTATPDTVTLDRPDREKPDRLEFLRLAAALALGCFLVAYVLRADLLYIREFVQGDESLLSVTTVYRLLGWLFGNAVVVLCAAGVVVLARKVVEPHLRRLRTAMLGIYVLFGLLSCIQILYAHHMIPRARWIRAILQVSINYGDACLYALLALALIAAVLALRGQLRALRGEPTINPAQRRKMRAAWRTLRRWSTVVAVCCLIAVFSLTLVKAYNERTVELTPAEPLEYSSGQATIPLGLVEDGHLHRFVHVAADGTEVRFIVIKKNATAYGVGLDACNICGATGYYERDDEVVCMMCDVVM
ncbi:MAG: Fe-S-containing protein, partial [Coriobacteriales bacterium]|nr:Fe-S-containing protein [Coriobacteriales bacterium]